jgi:hypothetical protein
MIAFARGMDGVKSLRLLASGDAAPQGVLAAALAGDAVQKTAVDLAGFDFDGVTDDRNPNLLPGAVKYGGIYAFATLCSGTGRQTLLSGARQSGKYTLAAGTKGLTLETAPRTSAALETWVLQ